MKGYIEVPFAHCCAEGGGSIEGCSCVNPNHGTAFIQLPQQRKTDELPARVLRYDGKTPDSEAGAVRCMECRTILKLEQFDDGYCDEICARTAMMKRTAK